MKQRGLDREFMDMNIGVSPEWGETSASSQGAGPLGFAGTVSNERTRPAGLTTVADNEFAGGPQLPMMPGTWDTSPDPQSYSAAALLD